MKIEIANPAGLQKVNAYDINYRNFETDCSDINPCNLLTC